MTNTVALPKKRTLLLSPRQRVILLSGITAIALTTFRAPYSYTGHLALARMMGGTLAVDEGHVYAPLWAKPSAALIRDKSFRPNRDWIDDGVAQLETGMLALWWMTIAGITIGAARAAGSHDPSEMGRAIRVPRLR